MSGGLEFDEETSRKVEALYLTPTWSHSGAKC